MATSVLKNYPEFTLQNIQCESCYDNFDFLEKAYTRIEVPASPENIFVMSQKGCFFVDRTLGVTINLAKNVIDYKKLIRFEIKKENSDKATILDIALKSFPQDRRFHVDVLPDARIANVIIRDYVEHLSEIYVCIYNGEVIGFIDLEPYGEKDCCIHLAAVRKQYRAVGASVSLYAHAIMTAKEKGCDKVYGRISSENVAVMNLYSRLGGIFLEPIDVFVKNHEIRTTI